MYVSTITEINSNNEEVCFIRPISFCSLSSISMNAINIVDSHVFFFSFLTMYLLALLHSLPFLSGCFISLSPTTPHSPASPGAFILAGCFLYENTPIGRQAPLSDTIHCTCIDMKSVLTSTTEFCGAAETAYQWQCRSCDQIKEALKFGDSYVDVLVRHKKVSLQQPQGSE